MKRCPKHEPVPRGGLLEQLRGDVVCKRCGMEGMISRGNRKFGRPPRIIWFRRKFAEDQAASLARQEEESHGE